MDDTEPSLELKRTLHQSIRKVGEDLDTLKFNTAIAQMMVFVNEATKENTRPRAILEPFTLVLAPFAPHLAEELHAWFGGQGSVYDAGWPAWDEAALAQDEIELVLQVNGKVRGKINVPAQADEAQLREWALTNERVRSFVGDKPVRKVIVVPGKLVNVVV